MGRNKQGSGINVSLVNQSYGMSRYIASGALQHYRRCDERTDDDYCPISKFRLNYLM